MIKLSICIPTYNRLHELSRLIESLYDGTNLNYREDVEVIISDNASTDGTFDFGCLVRAKYKNLKYSRNSINLGYAGNVSVLKGMASGEYIWLLGSDEKFNLKSITEIINTLKGDDIYVYDSTYHSNGSFQYRPTFNIEYEGQHELDGDLAVSKLVENACGFFSVFSFISIFIFKRDILDSMGKFGSDPYCHMLSVFNLLSSNVASVNYKRIPIVICGQGGNEWSSRFISHVELDISTAIRVCSMFNERKFLIKSFSKLFSRKYYQIYLKSHSGRDEWSTLYPYFRYFGIPRFMYRKAFFTKSFYCRIKVLAKFLNIR